ncbi:MAG: DUF2029 domain-containing protein [Sandaracinaceae bacterium]|nr:DUF2029 domain-containing protein [Sandaracinaceae bacterium]
MSAAGWDPKRHVGITLGLLALVGACAFAWASYVPHTFILRDGRFYTNTAATLTESLSLEQPYARSWYSGTLGWNYNLDAGWSNIALGRNGEHLPKHPLLLPVLSAPFFFALGLPGQLLFNLLTFFVIGGCAFGIARRYVDEQDEAAAAIAALALPLGTSILSYAYDYHVDTLLLALFLGGVLAIHVGRGVLAGVLLALIVTLKPTCLMWVPAFLLMALSPQASLDRRGLFRALAAGTVVLLAYAALNTWLFGRPHWAGYNRTLVVVDGQPGIADHVDAFSFPLVDGLRRLFLGNYGIARLFALFTLALPGWLLLARRAPRYVVGSVLALGFAVLVFAKYDWEGDRFLWPALGLLVPPLAASFAGLVRGLRALVVRGLGAEREALFRHAPARDRSLAALAVVAVLVAALATTTQPTARLERSTHAIAAQQLATHGTLSAVGTPLAPEGLPLFDDGRSQVSRDRSGALVARVSPLATALAAPFALFGPAGLLALHVALAALLAWLLVTLSPRPPTVLAAGVVLVLWLPGMRERVLDGGPALMSATALVGALLAAERGRVALAMTLACVATALGDAPLLIVPAVLVLLWRPLRVWRALATTPEAQRTLWTRLALRGLTPVLALVLLNLLYWGRPLATAADRVAVMGLDGAYAVAPTQSLVTLLDAAFGGDPDPVRAFAPLLLLALPGLGLIAVGRRDLAIALGLVLLSLAVPGVIADDAQLPLFACFVLVLPLGRALAVLGSLLDTAAHRLVARLPGRVGLAPALAGGVLLLTLLLVGVGRRALASDVFDVANPDAVRHARVTLAVGQRGADVPCDFLAWEYQGWECASYERGVTLTGLATASPARFGPDGRPDLHLGTDARGKARTIAFDDVTLGERLEFRVRFDISSAKVGTLQVLLNDEVAHEVALAELAAARDDQGRSTVRVDTSSRRGERVTLALRLASLRYRTSLWLRGGPR